MMYSVLAICAGACVGALSRWGLALWLSPGGLIPWGTLAANLIGGYLVGVCIATFEAMPQIDPLALLHVAGSLLLTIAGMKSTMLLIAARAH